MTVISVQNFAIGGPGGGPRILRALFEEPPVPVVNVCTYPIRPPAPGESFQELHMPQRPSFGRLDATRATRYLGALELALGGQLERRLRDLCLAASASHLHALADSANFWAAFRAAESLEIPFVLSVHDDPRYTGRGRIENRTMLRRLPHVWNGAAHRFVITEQLGEEYCQRYGEQPYSIVTDGLQRVATGHRRSPGHPINVYFAGLFHLSYAENLRALFQGFEAMADTGRKVAMTCRCGSLDNHELPEAVPLRVLPFAAEDAVRADLQTADLLYLPLPFGPEHEDFVRFSLSTKLITYLGSQVPILYHGPADAAAAKLLAEHDAAILVSSLEPREIAATIQQGLARAPELVANAQALAGRQFTLRRQRERFWSPILAALGDQTGRADLVAAA